MSIVQLTTGFLGGYLIGKGLEYTLEDLPTTKNLIKFSSSTFLIVNGAIKNKPLQIGTGLGILSEQSIDIITEIFVLPFEKLTVREVE